MRNVWMWCGVLVLAAVFGVACSGSKDGNGERGSGGAVGDGDGSGGLAGTGGRLGGTGGQGTGGLVFSCAEEQMCAGGAMCCSAGTECVDGVQCLPVCETTRCGSSGVLCCDEGQVCLDGVVCAAPCGEDQTVCGEDFDVCCPAGELCLAGMCTPPGDDCQDDFDCLGGGLFCEPTVGQCLPTPEGDDDPKAGAACQVKPEFEKVAVEVEWHWPGSMVGGKLYENVIATPVVGDISGDGVPDVVAPAYTGGALGDGILVALSGDTGEVLWTISGAEAPRAQSPAALGNFDDDAALEVVYQLGGGGVRIVDGDGVTELGRRTSNLQGGSAPSVIDIQGDGVSDVVFGCQGLDGTDISDTSLDFFSTTQQCGPSGKSVTVVANLDDDPEPEVTSGGKAFNVDGSELWNESGDGFPAVADLDVDGKPEVIVVRNGEVIVRRGNNGEVLLGPASIPGGGEGGAPTIADFDGDGLPEIATAGQAFYAVYDPDCIDAPAYRAGGDCTRDDAGNAPLLRWSTPTQDISSSVTGSSVFDFQGDGAAEVVYNDECFLHIYNGFDGSEPLETVVPNSSRTDFEYPLVVDVDRDGNSEIVVPANRDQAISRDFCDDAYAAALGVAKADLPPEIATGTSGIFVYGDPFDRWVGTRLVWNQFAYHVTNIEEDGAIPRSEPDNWTTPGLNNYRQNVQGKGVFNAPNLRATLEVITQCTGRAATLSALVQNVGSRGVSPGVSVQFFQTAPGDRTMVGEASTQTALLPGSTERVAIVVGDIAEGEQLRFEVVVDGATSDGVVLECAEDDNGAEASGICEVLGPS